jgi:hypothetical protein
MSDNFFCIDRHRAESVHGFIRCDRVAQVSWRRQRYISRAKSRVEGSSCQLALTAVEETRLPTEVCVCC